jgi:periplasmic divalent cation tolerance protein
MKVILSTTSNIDEAKKIANFLIENHLAACINIVPMVISVYEWDNSIQNDNEALMIIKTSDEKAEIVTEKILELHSYSLPEVIALDVEGGNSQYIDWVVNQVK